MINLLSDQQKEELLGQERLRLILILGILFLSFLFSLALILLLVKNYFLWDLEAQKITLEEKEMLASQDKELEEEIIESNSLLSSLDLFYRKKYDLTQTLEKIYKTFPLGTYLTNFNFTTVGQRKGEGEIVKISLSGLCPSRELLLLLKENLEKEESFSGVYFSPKSWVEPVNTNFDVIFNLNLE